MFQTTTSYLLQGQTESPSRKLQVKRCLLCSECVYPPKSYIYMLKTYTPNMMVEGGSLEGYIGQEGGILINEISVLIKEAPRDPYPLPPCKEIARRHCL